MTRHRWNTRCKSPTMELVGVLLLLTQVIVCAGAVKRKEQLDPATIKVLSGILDSLDSFTNHRLKDLEKIRLANPNATRAHNTKKLDDVSLGAFDGVQRKSNITDSIRALKEGIMAHRPLKKTFGYKVTVYTSPIDDDGKDGKPVLVTQYVGGDMMPDKKESSLRRRTGGSDLDESANNPKEVVHSSASDLYPLHVGSAAEESDAEQSSGQSEASDAAGLDHERKTEHEASSEKGHLKKLSEKGKIEKGHDRESHKQNVGEHHKESDKEAHREDAHSHDKGGATQQGIREKTEIEYYEREHFLDTDYDKAKAGHSKSSGLKETEKHHDHDSHDRSKEHSTHHHTGAEQSSKGSAAKAQESLRPVQYSPPYGAHYQGAQDYDAQYEGDGGKDEYTNADAKKDYAGHKESLKADSKAHKEHSHERDHASNQEDKAYQDKDAGRRKEGYRERGYKITAEREYFLNDAHHDKGSGKHRSGEKSHDREGIRHGAKEGERDRGFVKEHKSHDSHDAAYDAKARKFYDGEKHAEGFAKTSSSAASESKEKQGHLQDAPVSDVVYHQEGPPIIRQPPIPLYPHSVAYDSSVKKNSPVVIYSPSRSQSSATTYRKNRNTPEDDEDDQYDDVEAKPGYQEYANYNAKSPTNPVLADVRKDIRDAVKEAPPTYSKPKPKTENVKFPEEDNTKKDPRIRQYGSHLGTVAPEQIYSQPQDNGYRQQSSSLLYPTPTPTPTDYGHQLPNFQHYRNYPEPDQTKSAKRYPDPDYSLDYSQVGEQQLTDGLGALGVLFQPVPRTRQPSVYVQQIGHPQTNSNKKENYSPVVLLTRGAANPNNHAIDVWYTRP